MDLGCGDFRVASQLLIKNDTIEKYTGIDVVPDLIDYLSKNYGTPKINFLKSDISKEELPLADLYLVRQVFQHLSNNGITMCLRNIPVKSKLIVSEHQFIKHSDIKYNIDKIRGADVRIKKLSSLFR